MDNEVCSLREHDIYDLLPRTSAPEDMKAIGPKWVDQVKANGHFKARLVLLGWSQRPGIGCRAIYIRTGLPH